VYLHYVFGTVNQAGQIRPEQGKLIAFTRGIGVLLRLLLVLLLFFRDWNNSVYGIRCFTKKCTILFNGLWYSYALICLVSPLSIKTERTYILV